MIGPRHRAFRIRYTTNTKGRKQRLLGPSSPVSHTTMPTDSHPNVNFVPHWVKAHGSGEPFSSVVLNNTPLLDNAVQPQHVLALATHLPWGDFKMLKGVLSAVDRKELPIAQYAYGDAMHCFIGLIQATMGGKHKHASATKRCTLACASSRMWCM